MTDIERDLRDRLQGTDLPAAPERLRERLVAVAGVPRPISRTGPNIREARVLMPLAAVLALATVAVVWTVGGQPDGSNWGPLAVASTENGDEARTEGTIRLTDRCAFLEQGDERTTLVWPASRTRWQASDNAVVFERRTGERVIVRDGQVVALGGGGSSLAEDGLSGEEWAAGQDWVASPAPGCIADTRWFLNDVEGLSTAAPSDAELSVTAYIGDRCLSFGGCAHSIDLSSPADTWHADLRSVGSHADMEVGRGLPETLAPGSYSVTAWLLFMSDVIIQPGGRSTFGSESCSTELVVYPGDEQVSLDVHFNPDWCSIDVGIERPGDATPPVETAPTSTPAPTSTGERPRSEALEQWFGPEYPAVAPEGRGVWISKAELSPHRRTLTVEFIGSAPYAGPGTCTSDYEPWVGRHGGALLVSIVEVTRFTAPAKSGVVCVLIGYRNIYHLALPEPYVGSTVRDLNGGVLILD